MAKLWDKGYNINKEIEDYTVGKDYIIDKELVEFDVIGSLAHLEMLKKIKIIDDNDYIKLKNGLKKIYQLNKQKKFEIKKENEDCHTAIENFLTKEIGEAGKKIHTVRSRNDQVLTAIRLYSKKNILEIEESLLKLAETLSDFIKKNGKIEMPGYTHMQKAMPSSIGMLFGSYLSSLLDDLILLKTAYNLNNQSPLGTAAGYGVSIDVDRKLTAELLGFEKVQEPDLYAQNSRGKIESAIISALTQIMLTLNKIAIVLWKERYPTGFMIENKDVADSFRKWFKFIYENC